MLLSDVECCWRVVLSAAGCPVLLSSGVVTCVLTDLVKGLGNSISRLRKTSPKKSSLCQVCVSVCECVCMYIRTRTYVRMYAFRRKWRTSVFNSVCTCMCLCC